MVQNLYTRWYIFDRLPQGYQSVHIMAYILERSKIECEDSFRIVSMCVRDGLSMSWPENFQCKFLNYTVWFSWWRNSTWMDSWNSLQIKLTSFRLFRLPQKINSTEKKLRISEKFERGDGWLELGLLKLPSFGKKANGRVSGAPETCFFMFFGLNAAPSKTSNLSTFLSFQSQVEI